MLKLKGYDELDDESNKIHRSEADTTKLLLVNSVRNRPVPGQDNYISDAIEK